MSSEKNCRKGDTGHRHFHAGEVWRAVKPFFRLWGSVLSLFQALELFVENLGQLCFVQERNKCTSFPHKCVGASRRDEAELCFPGMWMAVGNRRHSGAEGGVNLWQDWWGPKNAQNEGSLAAFLLEYYCICGIMNQATCLLEQNSRCLPTHRQPSVRTLTINNTAQPRSAPLRSASRAEPHRDAAPTALWRPLLPARPAGRCSRLAASERSAAPPATRERSGAARREARRLRTGAARGGPSGSPSPPGVLSAAPASAVAARWRHRPRARTCLMRSWWPRTGREPSGGMASGPAGCREGGSAGPGRDGGAKRRGRRIAVHLSLQVPRGGLPGGVRRGQPRGGCWGAEVRRSAWRQDWLWGKEAYSGIAVRCGIFCFFSHYKMILAQKYINWSPVNW